MQKFYTPPQIILKRYADVLINFALNSGKGIQKHDVVLLSAPEHSKPLYKELHRAVIAAGGHVIHDFRPGSDDEYDFEKEFYENGKDHQIKFFAHHYYRGLVDQADHVVRILGDVNPKALENIDPKKILVRGHAVKPYLEWRTEKENKGKLTWTLALYPTPAMAKEARMSEKEYWNQVVKACFLDTEDPISKWQEVFDQTTHYAKALTKLKIDKVHVQGPDVDLWVTIGEKRKWLNGSGRNIPSFEVFTSPDFRGTNGWIKFNQPLYRYGNLVEGIRLEFKNGKVVKSSAVKNEQFLKQMIKTKNADKLGEFSLTDKRHSRITKFMAETLFDENMGGPHGNTHVALGSSYLDTYDGDPSSLTLEDQERLGYNNSSVHTDIFSTTPRVVTAYLPNGKTKVIYQNGMFNDEEL